MWKFSEAVRKTDTSPNIIINNTHIRKRNFDHEILNQIQNDNE